MCSRSFTGKKSHLTQTFLPRRSLLAFKYTNYRKIVHKDRVFIVWHRKNSNNSWSTHIKRYCLYLFYLSWHFLPFMKFFVWISQIMQTFLQSSIPLSRGFKSNLYLPSSIPEMKLTPDQCFQTFNQYMDCSSMDIYGSRPFNNTIEGIFTRHKHQLQSDSCYHYIMCNTVLYLKSGTSYYFNLWRHRPHNPSDLPLIQI